MSSTSKKSYNAERISGFIMEGGSNIQESDPLLNSNEEGRSGICYSCWNPRGKMNRFIALIFMCFLGFGSYFCYDNPAALEDHIKHDLNITTTQYTLLYSMYSWPNVVLCFLGGFLIDRVFGIRLGTNMYMGLTLLGQLLFASGVITDIFWIAIFGRFVFGIGAESLAVAQNNYAVLWFKGKELNMVFGLQLSFARLGSSVNFWVIEYVYEWVTQQYQGYEGLGIVLFLATLTCILSMLCSIILAIMDKKAEVVLRRNEAMQTNIVQLTDITKFKLTFWLLTVICVAYYVAILPFIGLGKGFFTTKFHMTNKEANNINSLVYLLSGVASPFLGLCIDKLGKNIVWIATAIIVTLGAHSLLAFTTVTPYVAIVFMGLAYACLAGSLWPLVALIIPEYQLGTAYGVCQAIQNLGLAVFTIVAGNISETYGYTWLEVFFMCSLSVALLATIVLWLIDLYQEGILNVTPALRLLRSKEDDEKQRQLISVAETSDNSRYLSSAPVSYGTEE